MVVQTRLVHHVTRRSKRLTNTNLFKHDKYNCTERSKLQSVPGWDKLVEFQRFIGWPEVAQTPNHFVCFAENLMGFAVFVFGLFERLLCLSDQDFQLFPCSRIFLATAEQFFDSIYKFSSAFDHLLCFSLILDHSILQLFNLRLWLRFLLHKSSRDAVIPISDWNNVRSKEMNGTLAAALDFSEFQLISFSTFTGFMCQSSCLSFLFQRN